MNAPQYVNDAQGKPVGVFLDIDTYQEMLAALEAADDARAFDEGMANLEGDELLSIDELRAELETVWVAKAQSVDR